MRLFIVERIPLRDLARLRDGPRNGDVVAYFRPLQDPHGSARKDFENRGITVLWAEGMLDHDDSDAIDAFHDSYAQNWYRSRGRDISLGDGISFGELFGYQYSINYSTGHIIRLGEICRRLLDVYGHAEAVLSDLVDGVTSFKDYGGNGIRVLRRTVLEAMVRFRNLPYYRLTPVNPVPSYRFGENTNSLLKLLRQFLGGFRWPYLAARMRLRRRARRKRRIYMFLNHGIHMVATALAKRGDVEVLIDRAGYPGTTPLRHDHLLALPPMPLIGAAWRLWRHVNDPWSGEFVRTYCTFNGFDYSPFLRRTAKHMLRTLLLPALIKVGQTLAMLRRYKPNRVVVNGESSFQVRTVIAEAKKGNFQVVFFRHGYVTYNSHFHPTGHNNPQVIYVANGTDHVGEYGTHLPKGQKPSVVVLPNPATSAMNGVRYHRPAPSSGRILALNFTSSYGQTVARTRLYDLYTLGLFRAATVLINKGYTFSYRPHSGDNPDYIRFAVEQMGLAGKVEIDTTPMFDDSLLRHDVVIVNVSSCHYQALYAGWPTIFFDPDYEPGYFFGLPAATDIENPIARNSEQLIKLVEEAMEPNSAVARFPEAFATTYATRFIGKDADRADEVMADFLARDDLIREFV